MARTLKSVGLVLTSVVVALLAAELLLHALTHPSTVSSGRFLDRELPPLVLFEHQKWPDSPVAHLTSLDEFYASPFRDLVVGGKAVTHGDLYGLKTAHPMHGALPVRNGASVNNWWQSNNLGARSRVDHDPEPAGPRTLLFGDSFTHGVLPQRKTFVTQLNRQHPEREILNFGVSGYSMSQAYMYFRKVRKETGYDEIVLVLVPLADLWREVSVNRYLYGRWRVDRYSPRFELTDGRLRRVSNPRLSFTEEYTRDPELSAMREHLKTYDRFYEPLLFEPDPWLDWSVSWRLFKLWRGGSNHQALAHRVFEPGSEALTIVRRLTENMRAEAAADNARFRLALVPSLPHMAKLRERAAERARWRRMAEFLCAPPVECIDLMRPMLRQPADVYDLGFDGGHFGKESNRIIARLLTRRMNLRH